MVAPYIQDNLLSSDYPEIGCNGLRDQFSVRESRQEEVVQSLSYKDFIVVG